MNANPRPYKRARDVAGFPTVIVRTTFGGYDNYQVFIAGTAQVECIIQFRPQHRALADQFIRELSRA